VKELSKYEKLREERAKIILSKEAAITKIKEGLFTVQSQTGIGSYRVEWNGEKWVCNCPDYIKNGTLRPCKHVLALKLHLEVGYVTIEGQEPTIAPVTYSQDWANYNQAQSQEIELFDMFLSQLVSTIDESEQHMGRPRLKLNDELFCCIMKVYSQLSLRRAHCLYHQALQRSQISHNPHYNAVSSILLKPEITPMLHRLVLLSAVPLAGIETNFAVDSSGFRCSSFGMYCEQKHGNKRMRNWLKVHIATGVRTNIVTDVVITEEHANDSPQFEKLVKRTAEGFDIDEIVADKAYSSRKNHEIVKGLGGKAFIPFKENATGNSRGSKLWRKAFLFFQMHKEEFEEHYHQRSNAESTFSAIKKKFGETLKSRKRVAQENEMLCKIIAYNITVLINAMFEFGITPDFLKLNDIKKVI